MEGQLQQQQQQPPHATALVRAHEAFLLGFIKRKRDARVSVSHECSDAAGFVIARKSNAFADVNVRQLERKPVDKSSRLAQVVLMVFKRFCSCQDKLLVKGKLVNAREIEIQCFAVLRNPTRSAENPEATLAHEDAVDIRDCCKVLAQVQLDQDSAETRDVGSIVVAQVVGVDCHATPALPVAMLLLLEDERKVCSTWTHLRSLKDLDRVYGFDVNWESSIRFANARDEDVFSSKETPADVNSLLMNDTTFRDVRGVAQMMRYYDVVGCRSFFGHATDVNSTNDYIALAKRQKRKWSNERLNYAKQLLKAGRTREALDEVTSSLKIDESNCEALVCRGELFLDNRKYHEAVENLEKALKVDPTDENAQRILRKARSKLAHSRHADVDTTMSDGMLNRMKTSPRRGNRHHSDSRSRAHRSSRSEDEQTSERKAEVAGEQVSMEKEKKLRKLLEESLKKRKRHRKDDKVHKRKKKKEQKKRKKKKDKYSRHKRSSSTGRRHGQHSRHHSNRNSEASSSDSSDGYSSPGGGGAEKHTEREKPHPILSRQHHRLWK